MTTTRITKMTITATAASTMPLATLILSALPAAIPSASADHEERHGYGYGCGVGRFDDGCLAEDGGILGGYGSGICEEPPEDDGGGDDGCDDEGFEG